MRKIYVNVHGTARGNPGEAAIGILVTDEKGEPLSQVGRLIGRATAEVAEYKALLEGIRLAVDLAPEEAVFLTDHPLVANQINGFSAPREPHLLHLNRCALELLAQLPRWRVSLVEPEVNHPACRLADGAFRERTRLERERAELLRELDHLLAALPLDDLRRVVSHVRSLRP
ncbi:MAG: reverse transcriptase-like protein [Candidatus Bipolaricaulota bacterium]|nr:reverse transcriptase-like protein [Candidatus Bipolaricaulota bacterium]